MTRLVHGLARAAVAAVLLLAPLAAAAQAPPSPSVRVISISPARAAMGDRIQIRTTGMVEARRAKAVDPATLVLYLGGRPMKGVRPVAVGSTGDLWEVTLRRPESDRDAWAPILGRPTRFERSIAVGLGPESGPAFPPAGRTDPVLRLVIARPGWFYAALVLWAGALALFLWMARHTAIIRDSAPEGTAIQDRPYSLARSQMALWIFLFVGAFLGVWMVTGDWRGIISSDALVLLGIAGGTGVLARTIEAGKKAGAAADAARAAELTDRAAQVGSQLASNRPLAPEVESALRLDLVRTNAAVAVTQTAPQLRTPISTRHFLQDVLKDDNQIALHRFQALLWTIILAAVFVIGTVTTLAMPQFDAALLALLGISGGTYLGFKIPEAQT